VGKVLIICLEHCGKEMSNRLYPLLRVRLAKRLGALDWEA
jgi:hypothetical protein